VFCDVCHARGVPVIVDAASEYDLTGFLADGADLVLAMYPDSLADIGGRSDRVMLFRDFDPLEPGSEVPDPYYGGDSGFEEVLAMVERTATALVDALGASAT